MKKKSELLEQRGVLETEFKALEVKIMAGTVTADEEIRFNTIVPEIEALDSEISLTERRDSISKRVNMVVNHKPTDNEHQLEKRFSLTTFIDNRASKIPMEGIEAEVVAEGQKEMREANLGSQIKGYALPGFIIGNDSKTQQRQAERDAEKRTLISSTGDTPKAGYTVQTDVLSDMFIDVFRNAMVLDNLGVTMLRDLMGNPTIPKKTVTTAGAWLSEIGAITLEDTNFGQVALTPHRVGAGASYSKTLLIQSSLDVEKLVRQDMAQSLARLIQLGFFSGSGSSNQPLGLAPSLVAASINLIAGGTNGLAPTWGNMVGLETAVADDNADLGSLGYVINSVTRGKLKTTEKTATSTAQFIMESSGQVNGYKANVTNSLRSNLTKGSASGVCSEAFFGNWNDALVGQWGGVDIVIDPYTGANSNTVKVYYNMFMDVAFRRLQSFSYIGDLLTT